MARISHIIRHAKQQNIVSICILDRLVELMNRSINQCMDDMNRKINQRIDNELSSIRRKTLAECSVLNQAVQAAETQARAAYRPYRPYRLKLGIVV